MLFLWNVDVSKRYFLFVSYSCLTNQIREMEILSILMMFWLTGSFNYPLLVEEINRLHGSRVELFKIIEDNEIHAASLVHELRNPLNSLMGTVTLLEKSFGPKCF